MQKSKVQNLMTIFSNDNIFLTFTFISYFIFLFFVIFKFKKFLGGIEFKTAGAVSNTFFSILIETLKFMLLSLLFFLFSFYSVFYCLGAGYFVLTKYSFIFVSALITVFLLLFFYFRVISLLLIKKNKALRLRYWNQKKNFFIFSTYLKASYVQFFGFCQLIYKDYLIPFMLIFLSASIYFGSYVYFFVYCIFVIQQLVLELKFFSGFRDSDKEDSETYRFHWTNDKDLIFFDWFLSWIKHIAFFLTFLSYFFKTKPLMLVNSYYDLGFSTNLDSLYDLQLFLALNFVGPILFIISDLLRFILGLHVIFFRNTRTKKPFVAVAKLGFNYAKIYAFGVSVVSGTLAGYAEYRIGGIDSIIKKSFDNLWDGVVRINSDQEREFTFLKDKGIGISREHMREEGNHIFNKPKLIYALGLPENSGELSKFTPKELNELDMAALIPEDKVLRHNLVTHERICAQKGTISDYIYSFSGEERDKVLSCSKHPPTNVEIHHSIQKFVMTVRSTPEGQIDYEDFLAGRSDRLLVSWKYGKSIWN